MKNKRKENEKKYDKWEEREEGDRKNWFEVEGKFGWRARYIKIVDAKEFTLQFWQEILNDKNEIVEIHHKFPRDLGHQKLKK